MKVKYLLTVIAIVAITKQSFAQYSQDAELFSTAQTGSTARIKAIGNAQQAIGGDLSSVSGNPAGIGFFTHSEASFTPEFNGSSVKGSYLGTIGTANSSTLNLNNASAVFYSRLNTPRGSDKGQGWLSLNFGTAYSRTNDFYENVNYGGKNNASSITNYYALLGNQYGYTGGNDLQTWAFNQFLTNKATTTSGAIITTTNANTGVNQTNNTVREGGSQEFSLSMGANYSNQLYLGVGIGITSIRYDLTNTFSETGTLAGTKAYPFNSAYSQYQTTTGSGFNARLGFIYKPVESVRIGGTFTTPTYYTIEDDYSEGLSTAITGLGAQTDGPQDYPFTYNFHTPLKVSGGIAVFIGHSGFITGDIEYVNYSSVRLSNTDGYNASTDNSDIKQGYKSTANAHLGGELKLDQLYLRAGYSILGDPQKNYGTDTKTVSGGIGYRFEKFYIDATYNNVTGSQTVFPYLLASNATSPTATLNKTYNNAYLTVGFKF